jgi:hypothetical protein
MKIERIRSRRLALMASGAASKSVRCPTRPRVLKTKKRPDLILRVEIGRP